MTFLVEEEFVSHHKETTSPGRSTDQPEETHQLNLGGQTLHL